MNKVFISNEAEKILADERVAVIKSTNIDSYYYDIYWTTPAGQEASFTLAFPMNGIKHETDADVMFARCLENEYDNYDISSAAYAWLDHTGHGRDGAPYEMIDVYNDFKTVDEKLYKLRTILLQLTCHY